MALPMLWNFLPHAANYGIIWSISAPAGSYTFWDKKNTIVDN